MGKKMFREFGEFPQFSDDIPNPPEAILQEHRYWLLEELASVTRALEEVAEYTSLLVKRKEELEGAANKVDSALKDITPYVEPVLERGLAHD